MAGRVLVQRDHLFTGMTEQPFAVAFRDKNNYVDLSGLAKSGWAAEGVGLHVVHLIINWLMAHGC